MEEAVCADKRKHSACTTQFSRASTERVPGRGEEGSSHTRPRRVNLDIEGAMGSH